MTAEAISGPQKYTSPRTISTLIPTGSVRFTVELIKDRDHFRLEVLERRGPSRDVPAGSRANDRGLMDFAVQMAARDEYRLLDIAEATERRVSLRDIDEHLRPHVALVVDDTASCPCSQARLPRLRARTRA